MIRVHEDWALFAFLLMEVTGFFAWLAFVAASQELANWHRGTGAVVLLLSLVAVS